MSSGDPEHVIANAHDLAEVDRLADDEPPSESPCFKSLARALARGDANLYKVRPRHVQHRLVAVPTA
jgi:hypothetical protein